jgi:glycosyltransferase involved in cell wall biosynthesis
MESVPSLSVVIPTYNNLEVLKRCLGSWEEHARDQPVELLVIEDGCRDGTPDFLAEFTRGGWGAAHVRWFHEENVHELRCTNRGFREGRGPLLATWQDDMFLRHPWFVPELLATFAALPEIGLLSLSRGLNFYPDPEPLRRWEDLTDWRWLRSTIGPAPLNWFRIEEVDGVIRPWVVRRACLEQTGLLDEAYCPTEWDEIDLCYKIRQAGWKTATHGYERLGAYEHLGSTTLTQTMSDAYKERVLKNGRLFRDRWLETIKTTHARPRHHWWRRATPGGWLATLRRMSRFALRRPVGPGRRIQAPVS